MLPSNVLLKYDGAPLLNQPYKKKTLITYSILTIHGILTLNPNPDRSELATKELHMRRGLLCTKVVFMVHTEWPRVNVTAFQRNFDFSEVNWQSCLRAGGISREILTQLWWLVGTLDCKNYSTEIRI